MPVMRGGVMKSPAVMRGGVMVSGGVFPGAGPSVFVSRVSGVANGNTANIRAALNAVIGGSADAQIFQIGDSTTSGYGGDPSLLTNGLHQYSRPALTAAAMQTQYGIAVNAGNYLGIAGKATLAEYAVYNTAWVKGGATNIGAIALGGRMFQTDATTNGIKYTPLGGSFTRARIFWKDNGTPLRWTASTGATGTLGGTSTQAPAITDLDMAGSATFITITSDTAAPMQYVGLETYNGASKRVSMLNAGWGGSRIGDWIGTTNLFSAFNWMPVVGAKLHVLCMGINDAVAGLPQATFQTNFTTLVNKCLVQGDVVVMTFAAVNTASASQDAQDRINNGIRNVAAAKSVPLIDINAMFPDWATSFAQGYMYDSLHPNNAGYNLIKLQELDYIAKALAA